MSQRFVIDINVNGVGGGGRRSSPGTGGALAVGALAGMGGLNEDLRERIADRTHRQVTDLIKKKNAGLGEFVADPEYVERTHQGFLKAKYTVGGYALDDELPPGPLKPIENISSFYGSRFDDYMTTHKTKIKNLGVAAAWKTADALVDRTKYRSGDSYQNRQLDISMKIAGYGAALAMSGAAAPLVAVGIIGNEIINVISDSAQYNYNLKLERQQITNMKAVAGNISYGRDRGGI